MLHLNPRMFELYFIHSDMDVTDILYVHEDRCLQECDAT
jgi:hypothetical protein